MQTDTYRPAGELVQAVQISEDNVDEVRDWCGGRDGRIVVETVVDEDTGEERQVEVEVVDGLPIAIDREGMVDLAGIGDYIVQDSRGFRSYLPGALAAAFEPVT